MTTHARRPILGATTAALLLVGIARVQAQPASSIGRPPRSVPAMPSDMRGPGDALIPLALEVEPGQRIYCRDEGLDNATYWNGYAASFPLAPYRHPCNAVDESVSRQVEANLAPGLEGLGYRVARVRDAQLAVRERKQPAAVRIDLHASPIYLVHSADSYDKQVVAEYETGAKAWGDYTVYIRTGDKFATRRGALGPFESHVQQPSGAGRAMLDDEEAVARVFADAAAKAIQAGLTGAPPPEESTSELPPGDRIMSHPPRGAKPVKAAKPPKEPRQPKPEGEHPDWDKWAR